MSSDCRDDQCGKSSGWAVPIRANGRDHLRALTDRVGVPPAPASATYRSPFRADVRAARELEPGGENQDGSCAIRRCDADGWVINASDVLSGLVPDSMVSVVVSIRMRKMFAEVRKMFSNARHAEQDVRERQASRNLLNRIHVLMKLPDKREGSVVQLLSSHPKEWR